MSTTNKTETSVDELHRNLPSSTTSNQPLKSVSTAIKPETLINQLNWRYATKQFDPNRKISVSDWTTLEEALRLTPSSGGLQPWKFVVVTDPAVRAKLRPASYGQAQITDASHLVVFTAKNNLSEADVDAHIKHIAEVQGAPIEALAPLRGMLVGGIVKAQDEAGRNAWARNQVFIALGNLLTSAALLGIDACPMEGFDRAQYDEILGLKAKGYSSAVIATLGYRLPTDKYAGAPKVRFPKEQVFIAV
jgi:nitroreductase